MDGLGPPPQTDILQGVLCTPGCYKAAAEENDKYLSYFEATVTPETYDTFTSELEEYEPGSMQYKWRGYDITTTGSSWTIHIGSEAVPFTKMTGTADGSVIALITEADAAREDMVLVVYKNKKVYTKIPYVSNELCLSEAEGRIYFIRAGTGSGYHHYDTCSYISYLGRNNGRSPAIIDIYKRQDEHDTLHLASDRRLAGPTVAGPLPYLVLTNYRPDEVRVLDIMASLALVNDKYYMGDEVDAGTITDYPPEDNVMWASRRYILNVKEGRSILMKDGAIVLDILGWIDPVRTPDTPYFLVRSVGPEAPYIYDADKGRRVATAVCNWPQNVIVSEEFPYVVVEAGGGAAATPKPTLIVVYGSYGLRTRTINSYQYYGPLLDRGWRIVYILARGGGDNGRKWADAGRRSYHTTTIADTLRGVKWVQETYKCPWEQMALYARSAGGIPAGFATVKGVTGISWMEHPFLDVVETMSNPALPLTSVEWYEFGDPAVARKEIEAISPMDVAPAARRPGQHPARVLLRTGLKDTQVYAYEPLKYVRRLRELGVADLICAVEPAEGHFYGEPWKRARAADLALLVEWSKKISSRDIESKMVKTQRNKNSRRNKNRDAKRNKSRAMEGGKRKSRKAARATRRRVGRKH